MADSKEQGSAIPNSDKFAEIISTAKLDSGGSPKVYILSFEERKHGCSTRLTWGTEDTNKPHKTILLVGETGTGKSSLVNTLMNYAMGVKWEDNIWFKVVTDKGGQCESQTQSVVIYDIFGFEGKTLPFSLTIIDTPGFGSTFGVMEDVVVGKTLSEIIMSHQGVYTLNAVCLVLKSTENRISDRTHYIFNTVMSLFGKKMKDSIVVLFTHSDGLAPEDAIEAVKSKIQCTMNKSGEPLYFLFNNHQSKERSTASRQNLERFYQTSEKGMKEFTDFLEKTQAFDLLQTKSVLTERTRLSSCIVNLKERVILIELKKVTILQTENQLKEKITEIQNNENFEIKTDVPYKVKVQIPGGSYALGLFKSGATCCTFCEENCHYLDCTVARSPSLCKVMEKGRCTVCTNKCPSSNHVKSDWIYETKTKEVIERFHDMKKLYDEKSAEKTDIQKILTTLEEELRSHEMKLSKYLAEAYQHVMRLEEIALEVNSIHTHVYLDFLIEKLQEREDVEKVQKLMEINKRKNHGITAAIGYAFRHLGLSSVKNLLSKVTDNT